MHQRSKCLLMMTLVVLSFQNCDFALEAQDSITQLSRAENGQPYDGKPYTTRAACSDGTFVSSRIVVKNGAGQLYRENCQTIQPRNIAASDLSVAPNGESIRFMDQVYRPEHPAIPLPGVVSWFLQLTGILQPRPASIYIVDLFGNDETKIHQLKADGHIVICHLSAGTVENWNPDANQFPATAIGNRLAEGEHWIDTRDFTVRKIAESRLDLAKKKGCHGVNFDAADGFGNDTGFPLTRATQLEYNQFLAFAAHDRDLILSLSSVAELAEPLAEIFDFAVAEQCFEFKECDRYSAYINRGKPVLVVEYGPRSTSQCSEAKTQQLSLSFMSAKLDGSRYETCDD